MQRFLQLQRQEDEALERLEDAERRCVFVEKHSQMTLMLLCDARLAFDEKAIFGISKMALHELAQLEWLLRQTPSRESRRTEKSTIYNFLRVDGNDNSLDANIHVADAAEYHHEFLQTSSYIRHDLFPPASSGDVVMTSRSGAKRTGNGAKRAGNGAKEIVLANRQNCVFGAKTGSKGQIFMQVCNKDQLLRIPKGGRKAPTFLEKRDVKSCLKADFSLALHL